MLAMADIDSGDRVLDLASGAGSQTLAAARLVGPQGHVVANDISDTMLRHVRENAHAAALANVSTLAGAAEDLDIAAESFDAVICRLGLMLFAEPGTSTRGREACPAARGQSLALLSSPRLRPMRSWHNPCKSCSATRASRPRGPDNRGYSALGAPSALAQLLVDSGFVGV